MTYRFTIVYINKDGVMSQMRLREHSHKKARRKFSEMYPQYTIASVR